MELTAQLVHGESGRRVVEVRAYQGGRLLGSALGEAADAEAAEDRARQRLLERLDPAATPPARSLASHQSLVQRRAAAASSDHPAGVQAVEAAEFGNAERAVGTADPRPAALGSESGSLAGSQEPAARELQAGTGAPPAPEHPAGSQIASGIDPSATKRGNSPGDPARPAQAARSNVSTGSVRQGISSAVEGSIRGSIAAELIKHQEPVVHPNPAGHQDQEIRMNPAADNSDSATEIFFTAEAISAGKEQVAGSVPPVGIHHAAGPEASDASNQATGIGSGLGTGRPEGSDHPPGTDHPEAFASSATSGSPRRVAGSVASHQAPAQEPPADPEDWSSDLAALDLQLRRLGWDREREAIYLQRAFGHPSRNRLTNYSDLRSYLHTLDHLAVGSEPGTAAVPLRRSELLRQCDALLAQLGWTAEQGRALLERELQVASRQQLNDQQLLHFNMVLESELLAASLNQTPVVP